MVVLLTKQRLSQQFRQAGLGSKLLHSLLCLNIPDIHQDWDKQEEGEIKTVEMFRERREEVITEKAVTQIIHCLFNLILLSPIIVTGIRSTRFWFNNKIKIYHIIYLIPGLNIRERHEFIKPVIGVFPKEEEAYMLVSLLMWLLPLLVVLGACIDFALFFLYQTKLHTWKGLFLETPTVQEMLGEKDDSEDNPDIDILFR